MHTLEPIILVPLVISLIVFYVLVSVVAKGRPTRVLRSFAYFMYTMFGLTLFDFLNKLPLPNEMDVVVFHVGYIVLVWSGVAYLNFVSAVTRVRLGRRMAFFVAGALLGSLAIFVPGLQTFGYLADGSMSPVMSPSLAMIFSFSALLPGGYALYLCVRSVKHPRSERERRIMLLLTEGLLVSFLISLFFMCALPLFAPERTDVYQFSSVAVLVHTLFMAKAVSRYHFLSVNYEEIEAVSKSLFENTSEAVVVFGRSGEVVQANAAATALFGTRITHRVIQERIPGYDFHAAYDRWSTDIDDGDTTRHLSLSQSAVGPKGQPRIATLLLIRDISELVRLSEERDTIEQHIRQSEKLEIIGQLAGGIAHDFNNQLAGIVGYADLLREDLKGRSRYKRLVEGILLSAKHAADLTAQLLAFARKGDYRSEAVDLHDTVREVTSILSHSIDKRITLEMQLDAASSVVLGDPSQIQSAILNLGLNARDAMKQGGTLTFSTALETVVDGNIHTDHADLEAGVYVVLGVKDTGEGMDAEVRERIFEPFFTTKNASGGTGMGLAAVYGTVKNHKGAIAVESVPNEGTLFRIYLPRHSAEATVGPAKDTGSSSVPGIGRVLLVDDEPFVIETTSGMLERLGYRVDAINNGQAAVERYNAAPDTIDLVILDLVMPGMNGEEVFEAITAENPNAKILIASGYSMDDTTRRLLKAGAVGFIQKPYRKSELSKQMSDILGACAHPK